MAGRRSYRIRKGVFVSTLDLARHLGVGQKTIRRWLVAAGIKPVATPLHYSDERPRATPRVCWRVRPEDVERFLIAVRGVK